MQVRVTESGGSQCLDVRENPAYVFVPVGGEAVLALVSFGIGQHFDAG